MKITYFRLKGYIKVLNGMGLDEIIIPFKDFKNRIILVQGENGCSKSTIIAALTPNPDNSDSFRTDVFIDNNGMRQIIEYPAEKEIHYEDIDDNGHSNHYAILIQSIVDESRTRRTTKAFISKNGQELNPNGNVNSFKEIRDSLLGIDPIYLDLSSISAENRGLVDMIPSERRKYMASYIGSLDTYNNIFKVISKKVNSLKSYMNTLNSKIYELGEENELRLKLLQLENTLKSLSESRDSLVKELSAAETTVALVDPNNQMQDLYVSISERLQSINSNILKVQNSLDAIYHELSIDKDNCNITSLIDSITTDIKDNQDLQSKDINTINMLIHLNESDQSQLDSNVSLLNGLSSEIIQDNIEAAVEKIKQDIAMYSNYLAKSDIKIFEKISVDELQDLREYLNNFKDKILEAEDISSSGDYDIAVDLMADSKKESKYRDLIIDSQKIIVDKKVTEASLLSEISDINNRLNELDQFKQSRPTDCKVDSCPYISRFIDIQNSGISLELLNKKYDELSIIQADIKKLDRLIVSSNNVFNILSILNIAYSSILSKKKVINHIDSLKFIFDINKIRTNLKNCYRFPDFTIVDELIEKGNYYNELHSLQNQLKDLEKDLQIYNNNKALTTSLTDSINELTLNISNRTEQIKNLSKENSFKTDLISKLMSKLEKLNTAKNLIDQYNALLCEKNDLKNEFESVKDKIKLVKEKVDSMNAIKQQLSKVTDSITPLSNDINNIKFNLANIVEYQQEYKDSSEKYDKMVFIRNACSPGNGMGIQSEYIKRYMNDIIIDCNKMLGYMFNGTIQLDVPIINEKQFSIPFLGPNGIMVPDISNGSTAQKCMIGLVFSCIAMMKSSLKYNIPRFDEIDGGLDQQNRITFISVLNDVLNFMGSEQCIICSHNMEFDSQNTTRLLCSHTGIRFEQ